MELPAKFIQTVLSVHGRTGEQWLAGLDDLITYCRQKWQFELLQIKKLTFNFVAVVIFENGSKAILKLGLPGKEFQSEIAVLAAYKGNGFCQLLDTEPEKGIMLLECIQPGQHLSIIRDETAAANIVAKLIVGMTEPDSESYCRFQNARDLYNNLLGLHQRFGNKNIPEYLFDSAKSAWLSIHLAPHAQRLLHGDLHHQNILLSQNGEWKAIDPKGIISETAYELTPVLINNLQGKDPTVTIGKRIDLFSELLGIERLRIIQWGIFRSVLSAYWTSEDQMPIEDQDIINCKVFYNLRNRD